MTHLRENIYLNHGLIKGNFWYIIFVTLFCMGFGLLSRSAMMGSIFFAGMFSVVSGFPFSIEESGIGNRIYGLLPVTRSSQVAGRYLYFFLMGSGLLLGINLISPVLLTLLGQSYTFGQVVSGWLCGLACLLLSLSIQLPGFYWLGSVKGRFLSVAMFLITWSAFSALQFLSGEKLPSLLFSIAAFLAGCLLFFLSGLLSERIFSKKDL